MAARLGYISSRGLDKLVEKILGIDPKDYGGQPNENIVLVGEFAADKAGMGGPILLRTCARLFKLWLRASLSGTLISDLNRLIVTLSEGAAREYILDHARPIYNRRGTIDSRKKQVLEHILSGERSV